MLDTTLDEGNPVLIPTRVVDDYVAYWVVILLLSPSIGLLVSYYGLVMLPPIGYTPYNWKLLLVASKIQCIAVGDSLGSHVIFTLSFAPRGEVPRVSLVTGAMLGMRLDDDWSISSMVDTGC